MTNDESIPEPRASSAVTIEANDVTFSYSQFSFGPMTLQFAPGLTGLIGPNGAGKTTMMRLLGGLLKPRSGVVSISGRNVDELERRKQVAMGGSGVNLYHALTFGQHFDLLRAFYPDWSRSTEENLVSSFAIPLKKKVAAASAGMIAKFSLVSALSRRPSLVLLDEPWNALDPDARRELTETILDVSAMGKVPIVVSSHEMFEIEQVTDRFIFVRNGRIVEHGFLGDIASRIGLAPGGRLSEVYGSLTTR